MDFFFSLIFKAFLYYFQFCYTFEIPVSDTNGSVITNQTHTFQYPPSNLYPVPDEEVVEVSPFSDTLSGRNSDRNTPGHENQRWSGSLEEKDNVGSEFIFWGFQIPLFLALKAAVGFWFIFRQVFRTVINIRSGFFSAISKNTAVGVKSTLELSTVLALGPLELCAGKSVKLVSSRIADTQTVFNVGTHCITAGFCCCKANSLPVTMTIIQHHIDLSDLLKSTVFVPSYTTNLTSVDTGGYLYGPHVDSAAKTFSPDLSIDTILIHYQNDHFPACPIDSSFTIIQIERPWRPVIGDSSVPVGGPVNLKKIFLPNTTSDGSLPKDFIYVPASHGDAYFLVTRTE